MLSSTMACTHLLGQTEAECIPCLGACHDGHARLAARAQAGDAAGQAMLRHQCQHVSCPPSLALAFWLLPSAVPAPCEVTNQSLALDANRCICWRSLGTWPMIPEPASAALKDRSLCGSLLWGHHSVEQQASECSIGMQCRRPPGLNVQSQHAPFRAACQDDAVRQAAERVHAGQGLPGPGPQLHQLHALCAHLHGQRPSPHTAPKPRNPQRLEVTQEVAFQTTTLV